MVNHDTEEWEWNGKKYLCRPGQKITSLQSIAQEAGKGISIKNVRTAIERFEKLEFLANESTKQNRLITVLNWELYQSAEENRQSIRQRGGKGVATNKNERMKEEKKKDIEYTQIFETVYKNYPRPQAKADTFKSWTALLKQYTEDQLLQFAENYRKYYESIPENDRPFPYSSNNFFGRKAYFLDFTEPRKWDGKPRAGTIKGPQNKGNFEQRKYNDEYFDKLYKV